jgi:hypothetical protein
VRPLVTLPLLAALRPPHVLRPALAATALPAVLPAVRLRAASSLLARLALGAAAGLRPLLHRAHGHEQDKPEHSQKSCFTMFEERTAAASRPEAVGVRLRQAAANREAGRRPRG